MKAGRRSFFKKLAVFAATLGLAPQLAFRTPTIKFPSPAPEIQFLSPNYWPPNYFSSEYFEAFITAIDRAYGMPFIVKP